MWLFALHTAKCGVVLRNDYNYLDFLGGVGGRGGGGVEMELVLHNNN